MTNHSVDSTKVFHSMEQLKVELFPNMLFESEHIAPQTKDVDEADSLAEKLIHDLMTKPKGNK